MTSHSPIALFVYNRPEHTRRTLEALQKNRGADSSKLFIFADGIKEGASDLDRERLSCVRAIIRELRWPGEIEIIEGEENRGLKQSICRGIDAVLQTSSRVIVLEDDLETSPGFLDYMNRTLALYADQERVFQVSGFMVKNHLSFRQTGFLRVTTSWGWGTWRRAWRYYRDDANILLTEVSAKGRARFDLDGCSFHFEELERNVRGELNTWAVRWYASVFLQDGLCLYPRKTLVRNLGFDGSGIHCHADKSRYHVRLARANRVAVRRQPLQENATYLAAMQRHYRLLLRTWTGTRLRDRAQKKVQRILGSGP